MAGPSRVVAVVGIHTVEEVVLAVDMRMKWRLLAMESLDPLVLARHRSLLE